MMSGSGQIPSDFQSLPLLSFGVSGTVRVVDDHTVIKHPRAVGHDPNERDHAIERRIYERLGQHPRIVEVISFAKRYIVLERLKCNMREYFVHLQQNKTLPSTNQILRWSKQAAEGLQYLHEKNVFQVDIGAHNLLLDNWDNIKFCDFAGSSIDGERPLVCAGVRAEYPFLDLKTYQPTVVSELFSLGTIIYEISTTRQPYHDKSDGEIEQLYTAGQFPNTKTLLGSVIQKCWTYQYKDVTEVVADIERLQRRMDQGQASKLNDESGGFSFTSALFILATVTLLALRRARHPAIAASA